MGADCGFHLVNTEDKCEKNVCETGLCVLRKRRPSFHEEELSDGLAYLAVIWPFE